MRDLSVFGSLFVILAMCYLFLGYIGVLIDSSCGVISNLTLLFTEWFLTRVITLCSFDMTLPLTGWFLVDCSLGTPFALGTMILAF